MTAVTIRSDFRAQEQEICRCFCLFLFYLPWSDGTRCHDLSFLILSFKSAFLLSSFTLIKKLFSSSSLSPIRVISSAYLRLLIFCPAILIPACNSSSLAFHITCYACKLNKQGDNKQPCHSPFSILNQSVVPYKVLTVDSWNAHRFHRRQIRWSGIPISKSFPQFVMIHTVKGFSVVNETEVDVFLKFSCFLYGSKKVNVGNLISDSSAFSKSNLNIWNFLVGIMLKPSLGDFEHNLTSVEDECNCPVLWTFFSIALLGNWGEDWPFPVLWPLLGFPNLLTYLVKYFDSINF